LRGELTKSAASGDSERVTELEGILASVQIVDPPDNPTANIGFGSTITVQEEDGSERTYTVAGVDELAFEPDGISWISLLGKALLAAEIGSRIPLESGRMARVVKTAYRND
jgi:transcription elongation factor GreB